MRITAAQRNSRPSGLLLLSLTALAGSLIIHYAGGAWTGILADAAALSISGVAAVAIWWFTEGELKFYLRSVSCVFLSGLVLLNIGDVWLRLFGLAQRQADPLTRQLYGNVSGDYSEANLIAVVAIAAYVIGMCLAGRVRCVSHVIVPPEHRPTYRRGGLVTGSAGVIFFAVFVVEALRLGIVHAAYASVGGSRMLVTSSQFALSAVILFAAYSFGNKRLSKLLWLGAAVIYLFTATIGWRGYSACFLAAAFAVWMWYIKSLPKRALLLAYLILAVVWSAVGSERGKESEARDYVSSATSALMRVHEVLLYPLQLLSSQKLSVCYAVRFVEDHGIGWGGWYAHYLPYLAPNVFGEARAVDLDSDSQALAPRVTNEYVRRFGIGFTPIAEAYCNFGYVGCALFGLVVGLWLQGLQNWVARSPTPERLVVLGMTSAGVLWWLRNDSMQLGRYILWGLLLYYLIWQLFRLRGRGARPAWRNARLI